MTELTVEVRGEVFGDGQGEAVPPVFVELLEERITVEDLIQRTVEEQVRELIARRKMETTEARRALDRQYLTPEEVLEGAANGVVRLPSAGRDEPAIDAAAEARRARRAFEAGAYFVVVDGRQVERLDETVRFAPGTRVTFLRLVPLTGG